MLFFFLFVIALDNTFHAAIMYKVKGFPMLLNPFSHFIFLFTVKGLCWALKITKSIELFEGLPIGSSKLVVSNSQYVDYTLMITEALEKIIWDLKKVVQCFEMVLDLKVNFTKSSQLGINVAKSFIEMMWTISFVR